MRGFAFFSILFCVGASAQNWALINPAYKYNYSNDGSDTISNQIFVTHIDTLGVDSFRYELNGVAKLCDTCAGPELYLWTNSPQFLQRSVNVGSGVWHFHDPGSFVVLPQAGSGSTWVFDTLNNVQATVALIDTTDQFGSQVGRKTIDLSNGQVLTISAAYGILTWGENDLIGVHGPEVGRLIPTVEGFFPYGTGDIVQYSWGHIGCSPCVGADGTYRFTVASATDMDSSIQFIGDRVAYTHSFQSDWNNNTSHVYDYENGPSTLIAGSSLLPFFDLVRSYPGQVLHPRQWSTAYGSLHSCIAKHALTADGRYMVVCDSSFAQSHFMDLWPTQTEGLFSAVPYNYDTEPNAHSGAVYVEGAGLEFYRSSFFDGNEEYLKDGSVIAGDTTGTLLTDDQILTVHQVDRSTTTFPVRPNPANDKITIDGGAASNFSWRIRSVAGALVVADIAARMEGRTIDVSALAVGTYLLEITTSERVSNQCFIIAR